MGSFSAGIATTETFVCYKEPSYTKNDISFINAMVKSKNPPLESWALHKCKIIDYAETYEEAVNKFIVIIEEDNGKADTLTNLTIQQSTDIDVNEKRIQEYLKVPTLDSANCTERRTSLEAIVPTSDELLNTTKQLNNEYESPSTLLNLNDHPIATDPAVLSENIGKQISELQNVLINHMNDKFRVLTDYVKEVDNKMINL